MDKIAATIARRSPLASWRHSLLTGLGQCFLMAINIRNMASGHVIFLAGFTIVNTYVWVYMVRTVVHSSRREVFTYALGSAAGAVCGVLFSHYVVQRYAVTHLGFLGF